MAGSMRGLGRYAWWLLAYTVAVVMWGAFVRASFSGDGCGAHWPLCNGLIIPEAAHPKTWVEFAHRVSSGLVLPLIGILAYRVFRAFPRGSQARKFAAGSVFFTLTEAAVGAKLVLYGLVADNTSASRAIWMSAHLVNTFLLLAMIALTAWSVSTGGVVQLRRQGAITLGIAMGLLGVLVLGVSGAVTALGDTLFPVKSLSESIRQDFSPTAHFLLRLRLFHPLIATSVGVYIVLLCGLLSHLRPSPMVRRYGGILVGVFAFELLVGLVNVLLKAPVWLQVFHLLVADVLWIVLILACAEALEAKAPRRSLAEEPEPSQPLEASAAHAAASWRDYVALTKPRIISLLLFTTLAAMFVAAGGWPGGWLLLAVAVGGYMAAGAANAINMVFDRDIDGRMKRTAKRPTVTEAIPTTHALAFALSLAVGSFALLAWAANLLSAMLAMAGLLFYVVIYTMVLKRRTWHNIVIGGAAGSFPPLVGYSAVTGDLSPLAWVLFAVIFMWTPVHFWALALYIKDDYADAGIPMLPVVRGERMTVIQIGLYTVLTAIVSVLPLLQGEAGMVYLGASVVLNAILVMRSVQLFRQPDRPHAFKLFKFSMVYLALLFLMIAIDRVRWMG